MVLLIIGVKVSGCTQTLKRQAAVSSTDGCSVRRSGLEGTIRTADDKLPSAPEPALQSSVGL